MRGNKIHCKNFRFFEDNLLLPLQRPELPRFNGLSSVLAAAGMAWHVEWCRSYTRSVSCVGCICCNCSAAWKWEFGVRKLMKWGFVGFGSVFFPCKGSTGLSFAFLCVYRQSLYDFVEINWLQFGLVCAFKYGRNVRAWLAVRDWKALIAKLLCFQQFRFTCPPLHEPPLGMPSFQSGQQSNLSF